MQEGGTLNKTDSFLLNKIILCHDIVRTFVFTMIGLVGGILIEERITNSSNVASNALLLTILSLGILILCIDVWTHYSHINRIILRMSNDTGNREGIVNEIMMNIERQKIINDSIKKLKWKIWLSISMIILFFNTILLKFL